MARTLKDKREFKTKRKKFSQPLWRKRFERSHYGKDVDDNADLDFCPSCLAPTDFRWGFIECSQCSWGNHSAHGKKAGSVEEFEYESAA